jgi:glycosyltransferase involved in cell wall biosynthesis
MSRLVSAVIPTHNRRRELSAAIASALRQTRPLHELIVVDDGSADGSWEELQALGGGSDGTRIIVHGQPNAGPGAARNAGVRLASGEFIAFLDDDDVWHEEKTARQLALFEAQPELALVGCVIEGMDVFAGRRVIPIGVDQLLFRNYFLTPGVMVRRGALAATGGFAEDMRRCEDYDLWLRIATSHRCALLNEVLMVCGGGKRTFGWSGLSGDLLKMLSAEREVFRRWRARGGSAAKYGCALALLWLRFARRVLIAASDRAFRAR